MATKEWREANKDRLREYRREWYKRNKKSAIEKVVERRNELKEWYDEYKSSIKCNRCNFDHPAALVFHHEDPSDKEIEVSAAIHNGWGKEKILEEISKCEVLCANCHLIHHWKERQ